MEINECTYVRITALRKGGLLKAAKALAQDLGSYAGSSDNVWHQLFKESLLSPVVRCDVMMMRGAANWTGIEIASRAVQSRR